MNQEQLKEYAHKLMFDMNEEEYDTLMQEFDVVLKQMDLIGEIKGLSDLEPMTFPYQIDHAKFRKDNIVKSISIEEALKNAKEVEREQIKVPKVVDEA